MKEVAKNSGAGGGFRPVLSRKKRKGGVLTKSVLVRRSVVETTGNHSRHSETSDTTESESVDIEEKCLIEETSIDYDEKDVFDGGDLNQTPKSLSIKIKTKKVLGKPLGKINFEDGFDNSDFLNESALFLSSLLLKPSIHVFVCKSFVLDINLVAASTSSKFGGIICVTFTSKMAMMVAEKLAHDCGVIVNTNLKCLVNIRINWDIVIKEIPVNTLIEAVCTAISEFKIVVSIKIQLSILIRKNVVWVARADVDKQTWNFRDEFKALLYTFLCNSVNYTQTCCTTVCFKSGSNLNWALANTLVIKDISLHWLRLFVALCSSYNFLGHTSRNCKSAGVFLSPKGKRASLSAQDQFKLAKIYERKSVPVSHPLAFGGKTWVSVVGSILSGTSLGYDFQLGFIENGKPLPPVVNDLKKRLVSIESSLVSLVGQIGGLAKRLESFMPAVSQPSPGCQLPVTPPSQNQGKDIVMGVSSGNATSNKTAAILGLTVSPEVVKLENMLEGLSALVISLSAHLDSLALAGGASFLPFSQ
ncbi:hypothetical protein G9A89_010905 [Geosiphon pyriformis]|nr:hypothetical protein G9A89_010905 [Geosiphon pyriformis]